MGVHHRFHVADSLDRIEEDALPSLALLLGALLDAAADGRAGADTAVELRAAAIELDRIARELP